MLNSPESPVYCFFQGSEPLKLPWQPGPDECVAGLRESYMGSTWRRSDQDRRQELPPHRLHKHRQTFLLCKRKDYFLLIYFTDIITFFNTRQHTKCIARIVYAAGYLIKRTGIAVSVWYTEQYWYVSKIKKSDLILQEGGKWELSKANAEIWWRRKPAAHKKGSSYRRLFKSITVFPKQLILFLNYKVDIFTTTIIYL